MSVDDIKKFGFNFYTGLQFKLRKNCSFKRSKRFTYCGQFDLNSKIAYTAVSESLLVLFYIITEPSNGVGHFDQFKL